MDIRSFGLDFSSQLMYDKQLEKSSCELNQLLLINYISDNYHSHYNDADIEALGYKNKHLHSYSSLPSQQTPFV